MLVEGVHQAQGHGLRRRALDRVPGHEEDHAVAVEEGHGGRAGGDVPEELQDKARLAASNCPEYAITITENG